MNRTILLLSALILFPASTHGIAIRILHQDAQAAARANAFTATADNASAVYYNPAGLTQLQGQGHQFRLSSYSISYNVEHNPRGGGGDEETIEKLQGVAQLYYALAPEGERYAFGFGLYSPFGLGTYWPGDVSFRAIATRAQLMYLTFGPVAAWQITDTLSIGGGPTVHYSKIDTRRGIGVNRNDTFKFEGDDGAFGFTLGLRWQPLEQHAFGFSYHSASTMDYDGDTETKFGGLPVFRQDASFALKFPQHLAVAWSYRPTPKWNLELNIDWTDWDRVNSSTLKQATGNIIQNFDWRSSFVYSIGATHYLDHGLSLSAGYAYSENSIPDDFYNPAISDMNLHVFNVGAEKKFGNWSVAAAYQLGYGPTRTVSGSEMSQGQSADGNYQFLSHALSLALGRSF